MIGEDFASVLASAQRGDEAAFARLWLDVNPALVRYPRVVSGEVDEDVASETWVTVVRGLVRFRGDEMAWRGWVFTTARRRAVDEGRRRARRRTVLMSEPGDPGGQVAPDPSQVVLESLDTERALALVARLVPLQAESSCCGSSRAWMSSPSHGWLVVHPARSGLPPIGGSGGWPRSWPLRV